MKYMIMSFGDQSGMAGRPPEWMKRFIEFMFAIDGELESSGELVFQQGLADPSQARTVTVRDGETIRADGSQPAAADALAGFWVVDVESEDRALEIAGRIAAAAEAPIEVRPAMDAPPADVLEAFGVTAPG